MKFAKTFAIAALVLVVSLVGTMAVSAQGPRGGAGAGPKWRPDGGSFMESWAEELGVTVERMKEAAETAWGKIIGQAVEDGDLTDEQAEKLLERRAPMTGERMPFEKGIIAEIVTQEERHAATAEALGMTPDELQAELDDGAKLRDLIQEAGLDMDDVQEAMDALWTAEIEKAVDDGTISQEEADELLAKPAFPGRNRGPRAPRSR